MGAGHGYCRVSLIIVLASGVIVILPVGPVARPVLVLASKKRHQNIQTPPHTMSGGESGDKDMAEYSPPASKSSLLVKILYPTTPTYTYSSCICRKCYYAGVQCTIIYLGNTGAARNGDAEL